MKISVLIPVLNEEKTIYATINSCLLQTRRPDQIVVVNDGSTDNSINILKSFGSLIEIVDLPVNSGSKSRAQQAGLQKITGDIFVTTDADTVLHPNFIERVEKAFSDPAVSAFAGFVKSQEYNAWTAAREIDYVIGQTIHKRAQSNLNAIYVIPGCAGAFRTKVFREELSFEHDTLTEDLDFTFKLHEKGLKITYDKDAIAYTQDPGTFSSYVAQMRRWYAGGWQNLRKHLAILNRPQNILHLSITYVEGLLFSSMLFIVPLVNLKYFTFLLVGHFIVVWTMALTASLWSRRGDLLIFAPFYLVTMYINAAIFLEQFIKEMVLNKGNLVWFSPTRRIAV